MCSSSLICCLSEWTYVRVEAFVYEVLLFLCIWDGNFLLVPCWKTCILWSMLYAIISYCSSMVKDMYPLICPACHIIFLFKHGGRHVFFDLACMSYSRVVKAWWYAYRWVIEELCIILVVPYLFVGVLLDNKIVSWELLLLKYGIDE